jgi:hypothetical protein
MKSDETARRRARYALRLVVTKRDQSGMCHDGGRLRVIFDRSNRFGWPVGVYWPPKATFASC